jgi:hypothetical protein
MGGKNEESCIRRAGAERSLILGELGPPDTTFFPIPDAIWVIWEISTRLETRPSTDDEIDSQFRRSPAAP